MSSLSLKIISLVDNGYFDTDEAAILLSAISNTINIKTANTKKRVFRLTPQPDVITLPTYFENLFENRQYI